jgi:hypothetical protein
LGLLKSLCPVSLYLFDVGEFESDAGCFGPRSGTESAQLVFSLPLLHHRSLCLVTVLTLRVWGDRKLSLLRRELRGFCVDKFSARALSPRSSQRCTEALKSDLTNPTGTFGDVRVMIPSIETPALHVAGVYDDIGARLFGTIP